MSKYSNELKLKVVKYCIDEHHGYVDAAKHFGIASETTVLQWVRKYQKHGIEGLFKNLKSSYSGEFKINVVEYMHNNHLSLSETAFHFNLANHSVVRKWEYIYLEKGPQALYKEQRGKNIKIMSSKPRKNNPTKKTEKELIDEIEQLKMENEYLKKLNALVQERIKRENKKK